MKKAKEKPALMSNDQKERRRLSTYASNDNRISFDFLKVISLSLVGVAIFIGLMVWLQAFRPAATYPAGTYKEKDFSPAAVSRVFSKIPKVFYITSSR